MNAVTLWFSTMSRRLLMSDGVTGSTRGVRRDGVPSPDDLLLAAGRGERDAFGLFYDHVGGLVFGLVRAVVRDPATTEILVHDIFLELWHSAARFSPDHDDAVRRAMTLAHRRAVEFVRATRVDPCHGARGPGVGRLPTAAGFAGMQSMREECVPAPRGLAALTESQREAVLLAYFGGKTYDEVSEALNSTATKAIAEIRDGMIRLRSALC